MPRRADWIPRGPLHHIIVRGIEKRRIVDDDQDRDTFVLRLGDLAQMFGDCRLCMVPDNQPRAHSIAQRSAISYAKLFTSFAGGYNLRHRRYTGAYPT